MAEAVEGRRLALGLTIDGFMQASGLSRQQLTDLRAGRRKTYRDVSRLGVARALRWRHDWYDRLVAGDQPVEADAPPAPAGADRRQAIQELAAEVRRLNDSTSRLNARLDELLAEDERERSS